MKTDIYQRVTDKIIADLEAGVPTWQKPWNAQHAAGRITRPLRWNGLPYSGINVILLWAEAETRGYSAPIWVTYKQAQELGGQVRKGEKSAQVVYANAITRTEHNEATGEDEEHRIPFMKAYNVFNVEQIDGLPEQYYGEAEKVIDPVARDAAADTFFANVPADLRHGGDRAYYAIDTDYVQMPHFEFFRDPESYYATLAHEITHWTRHKTRLNRDFGRKRWGDEGYAAEELVAELGAAFLCADLGLALEPRPDHASYIDNWLQVLKRDKRAIFTAAAYAQKAVEHLHGYQSAAAAELDEEPAVEAPIAATMPPPVPQPSQLPLFA